MSITKSFCTVSGLTVISRILGGIREICMSHFLGAGIESDAFLTAFKFPSFFRRCFSEGGGQAILVPYFSKYIAKNQFLELKDFSSSVFSRILMFLVFISTLVIMFSSQFVALMAPGFVEFSDRYDLAVDFTCTIFPSVIFIGISCIYSSILISNKSIVPFPFSHVLINIILIFSIILSGSSLSAGKGLSYGVLLAGVVQSVFLFFCIRGKNLTTPRFCLMKNNADVNDFFKKLSPVILGAGISQINVFINSYFGSFLQPGAISLMYYADRFMQFPLAVFGISMSTVLIPEISSYFSRGDIDKIKEINKKSLLFILRMTIPCVFGMIAMSHIFVEFLYGHGKFSGSDVHVVSNILSIFSVGIPAYAVGKIFSSILFAQKDSKTPMNAAVISILSNVILNLILVVPFGVVGLAVGTSISGFLNALFMYKKVKKLISISTEMNITIVKIITSSAIMFFVVSIIKDTFAQSSSNQHCFRFLFVCFLIFISIVFYIISLLILRDKGTMSMVSKLRNSKM